MKNNLIVIVLFILAPTFSIAQVTIKGTTVGERNSEVEEIIHIKGNDYLMTTINNKSGVCCYMTLIPVDSEKEILNEWVTASQLVGVLETFQNTYGEKFAKKKLGYDMLSYVYKIKGCEIQITMLKSKPVGDSNLFKMVVEIWHEKALKERLGELSMSWQDWENRDRNIVAN